MQYPELTEEEVKEVLKQSQCLSLLKISKVTKSAKIKVDCVIIQFNEGLNYLFTASQTPKGYKFEFVKHL